MKKAMIISVGTGTRPDTFIVNPLKKSIRNSRPDYVCFIASEASREYAERIAFELSLNDDEFAVIILESEDKIDEIFRTVNGAVRRLAAMGFESEDLCVDYTSGTKAMTGGLLLSAAANSCGELKYITGRRANGVVVDGTEQFLTMSPAAILAHREIRSARRFILNYRFASAGDLLTGVNRRLLDDYDGKLADNLTWLANAFSAWDKFDHRIFLGEYKKVDFDMPELTDFQVSGDAFYRIKGIVEAMKRQDVATGDILADIYNNASRRMEEGKYDDAMARFYRLTEMTAQWALAQYGINSSDVAIEKTPEFMHDLLEAHRKKDDGAIKIGLDDSYSLLKALGSELGKQFRENDKIRGLLKNRNNSILAHGIKPVEKKEAESIQRILWGFLSGHVPDFVTRANDLRFPWSKNSPAKE